MDILKVDDWIKNQTTQFILVDGYAVRNKDGHIFKIGDNVGIYVTEEVFGAHIVCGFDEDLIHFYTLNHKFQINEITRILEQIDDQKEWVEILV